MPLVRKTNSPFWWYDFCFNGKRYRGSTKKSTKQAASTVEAAVLTRLTEGLEPDRRSRRTPTLREFSTRFLAWVDNSRALEPNTRKYYLYGWRLISFTPLASMHIDQITAENVDCTRFQRPVIDRRTGDPVGNPVDCSPTYTNQALRTLKVMLGKAQEWDLLKGRPKISAQKAPGRTKVIDSAAEASLEHQFTRPDKNSNITRLRFQGWLVMLIMQDAGMRPAEVFAMRKEDINWADRRVWIPRAKTAKGRRFVGLTERMHETLSLWLRGDETPGWVFPARSKKSKTGHLTSISNGFKAARDRAGLDPRIVPYTARHTFGTFGVAATGNIFAVSAQMGHVDIKSMEPYQHQELDGLLAAVNKRNATRSTLLESRHTPSHTSSMIQ